MNEHSFEAVFQHGLILVGLGSTARKLTVGQLAEKFEKQPQRVDQWQVCHYHQDKLKDRNEAIQMTSERTVINKKQVTTAALIQNPYRLHNPCHRAHPLAV